MRKRPKSNVLSRRRLNLLIDMVSSQFEHHIGEDAEKHIDRRSISYFLVRLGEDDVFMAVDLAINRRMVSDCVFKYFCGICWKLLRCDHPIQEKQEPTDSGASTEIPLTNLPSRCTWTCVNYATEGTNASTIA